MSESEEKTVTLGSKVIKLNEIHAHTFPEELSHDDMSNIDAYLTTAKLFQTWLANDAPEEIKDNPNRAWKQFCNYLSDMAKYARPKNHGEILDKSTNLAWLEKDVDLDRYPFNRATIFDYFSSVFWCTDRICLPDHVGKRLVDSKGKIIKRIRNIVYKELSVEFPDIFWQFLGGVIKGFICEPASTVYWRITDNLLWTDGSFADEGSCMLSRDGSYRNGLRGLITAGSYAIQFFSSDVPKFRKDGQRKHYTNGIGRAYLIIDDSGFCVLNGYGTESLSSYSSSSKCTDKIAAILSEFVGIEHSVIPFRPQPTHLMYVNDDGYCRYFPTDGITDRGSFTLDITPDPDIDIDDYTEDDDDEDYVICDHCGSRVWYEDVNPMDGSAYCDDCFHQLFVMCDHCNNYTDNEYSTIVNNGSMTVCDRCADRYYYRCESCDEYYTDDNVQTVFNEDHESITLCQECVDDGNYVSCDHCGDMHHVDNLTLVKDEQMCFNCHPEESTNTEQESINAGN